MKLSLSDWWVLEAYREGRRSTFTHWGNHYSLDKVLELTENKPTFQVFVGELTHNVIRYTQDNDLKRVEEANVVYPILVVKDDPERGGLYWVVDGNHRLKKLRAQGKKKITCILVTPEMLEQARLTKRQYEKLYE